MSTMSESDFLEFIAETLMAEEPLEMDVAIPEDIFDSTGKLLLVVAFANEFNITLSVEKMLTVTTPRDLYAFLL